MLSATKIAHLKLTHLHSASNALFISSPPISAHLSSRLSASASKSNIQLSGSTWKKTCAACGYALVPGWTCSVRVRGIGGDPKVGWIKKSEGRVKHAGGIGDARALTCTGANVEKDQSRRLRKRGKRTRGARSRREKTEPKEPSTLQILVTEADESSTANTSAANSATTMSVSKPVDSRKRPKTTSSGDKEPRMVYSCKICSNRTIHSLPKKPAAASHDKATSEVSALQPTSQTAVLSKSSIVSASKPTFTGNSLQPITAPATATNAAAKKRAKSRKNTLSDMLAKEAANRSAATGSGVGGFGFDLMDFMKTS
ncbi:hypothetical protein TWF730_005965 [Orbilia blumenaviensis]|uniref:Uncharacterized protein n=1 Tax=Orbilia blumenaviensis TaxID=1796055 RepID=A0AAV9VK51_9PEZI